MKSLFIGLLAAFVLGGCSMIPPKWSAVEDGAAQVTVQSSERAICRDLPIGPWIKLYGMNPSRLQGWQDLCFNPIVTPLNAETVDAILKVYPGFANNKPAAAQAPATTNVPTQAVQAPAATIPPANPVSTPAVTATPNPAPATANTSALQTYRAPKKASRSRAPSTVAPPVAPAPAAAAPASPAASAFGTLAPNPNFPTTPAPSSQSQSALPSALPVQ